MCDEYGDCYDWDEDGLEEDYVEEFTPVVADSEAKFPLAPEEQIRFIRLLLEGDKGALIAVADYLDGLDELVAPSVATEVFHTLWNGQEDHNGFWIYHIIHGLETEDVMVSLDSTELYSYKIKNDNTVVIMCPERLWGVDVSVKIKDAQ